MQFFNRLPPPGQGRPGYAHARFGKTVCARGCLPSDTSRPARGGWTIHLHQSAGVRVADLHHADLRSGAHEPKRDDAAAALAHRARALHQLRDARAFSQPGSRADRIALRPVRLGRDVRNRARAGAEHEQLASCSAAARCRHLARGAVGGRHHVADGCAVDADLPRDVFPAPSADRPGRPDRRDHHPDARLPQRAGYEERR